MKKQQISLTNFSLVTILIGLLLFGIATSSKAQQAVGINNSSPDASSILDITSTTQGVLIPRMTTAQRDAIASPATGLLVYVSSDNNFYFYNGTTWELVNTSGDNDWTEDANGDYFNTSSSFTLGTAPPLPIPFGRLEIFETGTNRGIYANSTGSGDVLNAITTGTGRAGFFEIANSSNSSNALFVTTNGTGKAGYFEIDNTTNSNNVLEVRTNGNGNGLEVISSGFGRAGFFQTNNSNNSNNALEVISNGHGNSLEIITSGSGNSLEITKTGPGKALEVINSGFGPAGFIETTSPGNASITLEVLTNGTNHAGHFEINNMINSNAALLAKTNGIGFAGKFEGGNVQIEGNGAKRLIIQSNNNNEATLDLINQGFGTDWRINSKNNLFLSFEKSTDDLSTSVGVLDLIGGTPNSLEPATALGVQLGSLAFRYTALYAQNGTIQTSDKNFKKNIKELNYGLNAIMQMRPVSFDWKNLEQENSNLGFIAQEIEEIVPEVIVKEKPKNKDGSTKPGEDIYGMKYSELIPVLVKAIQEQQAIIENQQTSIETLKKEVKELKGE